MSKLDRRKFSSLLTMSGLGIFAAQLPLLTGCGTDHESDAAGENSGNGGRAVIYGVTVYDLIMYGYSNFSGDRLGQTGILKATMIRDSEAITLPYTQDRDGHKFSLTPDDFQKLKEGQKVTVETTVANSHTHKVVIDPAIRAPNAESIAIPDPSNPEEKIFVTIEANDQPRLFMQGTKPLDPESVEYCLDTKEACSADAGLWHPSGVHLEADGRQVLVSKSGLTLDRNEAKLPLMVRGKLKDSSELVEAIFEFIKK